MEEKQKQITKNTNILIGCTGSVAVIKLPEIIERFMNLNDKKFDVKVIITQNAKNFLDNDINLPETVKFYDDDDEWNTWKKRGDPVLHIELRNWADILVLAPLDANSLAKISNGICDNLLTCVVRAWDFHKPILFAPAMNTHMYEHPITEKQIKELKNLGFLEIKCIEKKLMCGEFGYGAMALPQTIIDETLKQL